MRRRDFELFASDIRPKLSAKAAAVTGDRSEGEDIAQDCLLKLWIMRESLDGYTNPEALAMTITYRMALNRLRHRRNDANIDDAALADTGSSPEDDFIDGERTKSVNAILASLPDASRAIIEMRHIEGMSCGEIAALIGSTDGAVRTALSRARQRVARMFLEKDIN